MFRIKSLIIFVFCAAGLFTPVCAQPAAEIWVSPAGNDANPGTREQPKASVMMAQRQARELRRLHDPSAREGIRIILLGGAVLAGGTAGLPPRRFGDGRFSHNY
ncbi:MAG: hypothetical protein AB2L20_16245 [Mangrovibacterium sp.]